MSTTLTTQARNPDLRTAPMPVDLYEQDKEGRQ